MACDLKCDHFKYFDVQNHTKYVLSCDRAEQAIGEFATRKHLIAHSDTLAISPDHPLVGTTYNRHYINHVWPNKLMSQCWIKQVVMAKRQVLTNYESAVGAFMLFRLFVTEIVQYLHFLIGQIVGSSILFKFGSPNLLLSLLHYISFCFNINIATCVGSFKLRYMHTLC